MDFPGVGLMKGKLSTLLSKELGEWRKLYLGFS
jgi:hypothetical protein